MPSKLVRSRIFVGIRLRMPSETDVWRRISSRTVESVHLRYLPALMVSPQQRHLVRVSASLMSQVLVNRMIINAPGFQCEQ